MTKDKILFILAALASIFGIIHPCWSASQEDVTVEGIVEAVEEDTLGNPKAIGIGVLVMETDSFIYYFINPVGPGGELWKLIGETVKATGSVLINEKGKRILTVEEFQITDTAFFDSLPKNR